MTEKESIDSILIDITGRCYLDCLHCYNLEYRDKHISKEVLCNLFTDLASVGCKKIDLGGGEPLLYPDFKSCVKHGVEKGLHFHALRTTGLEIKKWIPFLRENFEEIYISLEGDNPKLHNAIRGDKNFSQVVKALDLLSHYQIRTTVVTTLGQYNINQLNEIYLFLQQFPYVQTWELGLARQVGSANQHWHLFHLSMQTAFKHLSTLFEELNQISKKNNRINISMGSVPALIGYNERFRSIQNANGSLNKRFRSLLVCGYHRTLYVKPDGTLHYCQPMSEVSPKISLLANLNIERFRDIWPNRRKNSVLYNIRVKDLPICSKCKYLPLCGGGCRASSLALEGDISAFDPLNCELVHIAADYSRGNEYGKL